MFIFLPTISIAEKSYCMAFQEESWSLVVTPRSKWLNLNLFEIWKYRDLLFLFVKREITTVYKQTILGPLWYFIQPILTTIMFTVVFGNIAKISTDGLPPVLFYLSGIIVWNYFAECFRTTSDAFTKNEDIFGKVYFPRVVVPLAIVVSNLIKFGILVSAVSGYFAGIISGRVCHCRSTYWCSPFRYWSS